ncbi:SO_0444 family Cu/Zn efflux transporter [Planctomycetota bacterium]
MIEFAESIVTGFWETVAQMSPYLLFGFFVAGLLSVFLSQEFVERHLGGKGIWPLLKASAFGVPLPLCSCGVIPVSMSLHKHGASRGATISFLLSTPQTGVDSILVTLSLLGPIFAVFRPVIAFITGVIGGGLVNIFTSAPDPEQYIRPKCSDPCCMEKEKSGKLTRGLKYGFITLPRDIGKAMIVGLAIAAAITTIVPTGFFAEYLGTGILAMVVMIFLGIPVYVCATASVPIAAAMILKGLTPGAALVFLMTGPATNAASFITIWKILGRTTALTYIAVVAGCAIASGIALDYFVGGIDLSIADYADWMLPQAVKNISAVLLLAILINSMLPRHKEHH